MRSGTGSRSRFAHRAGSMVPRPGIGIVVLDEERAARLGITGVVIDRVVPGSEADRAGLAGIDYRNRILGDVIVAEADRQPGLVESCLHKLPILNQTRCWKIWRKAG